MGRLLRLSFSAVCLLSLLGCLATAWLWRQSYRTPPGGEYHASSLIDWRHARYTVRSDQGRLTLYAPPTPPPKVMRPAPQPGEPVLEELAAQVTNGQLRWQVARIWASDRPPSFRANDSPRPRVDTPGDTITTSLDRDVWYGISLSSLPGAKAMQAELDALQARLLRGLDEPERALAAHVILTELQYGPRMLLSPGAAAGRLEVLPDESFAQTVNGVRVLLRPEQPFSPDRGPGHDVETRFCSASVEPGQLAAARDLWHRQLDVPVGSAPHWSVVAATALPPLAWFGMVLRRARLRRRRQRRGLCRRCGYDLTGNMSGQCSECGQPVEREAPA